MLTAWYLQFYGEEPNNCSLHAGEVHNKKPVTAHSLLKDFHCVNPHSCIAAAGWVPDLIVDRAILGFMFKDFISSGQLSSNCT